MKWRVILEPDSETGEWAVWCPELPGCTSAGDTEEEALENIREAIQLYLEVDPKAHSNLSEATPPNRQQAFGIWQGKVRMSDDFDAPLDFAFC